jgi:hypothetical protein
MATCFPIVVIDSNRPVDGAHATLSDFGDGLIGPDILSNPWIGSVVIEMQLEMGWVLQQVSRIFVIAQERLHFLAQQRFRADAIQVAGPLIGRKVHDRVKCFPNL